MILKSLLKGLDYEVIKGNEESKVQNIRYDNRKNRTRGCLCLCKRL